MKYTEDGSVEAENAAEVMQCLLAGMVSDDGMKLVGAHYTDGQDVPLGVHGFNKPRTFRRPAVKEPEWFGIEAAISKAIYEGVVLRGGTTGRRVHQNTLLSTLRADDRFCLETDYARWQSELAAQPKPYEPMEEEVEEMAKKLLRIYHTAFDGHVENWESIVDDAKRGAKAEARYVLQRIHEARQFALPEIQVKKEMHGGMEQYTVPFNEKRFDELQSAQRPQKTEGLTLWECAPRLWPDGTEFECHGIASVTAKFKVSNGIAVWRVYGNESELNSSNWRVKKGDTNE